MTDQAESLSIDQIEAGLTELGQHFSEVASAWGPWSQNVAYGFFQRSGPAVEDCIKLKTITEVAPRTWFIRMPFANVVLFETDEGLVMVDSGGAAHGPALLEAVRQISRQRFHTAIYTHAHIDHAYGLWAFQEAGLGPQHIVAHENLVEWFSRYLRLRGLYCHHNQQAIKDWPADKDDLIWPTRTYRDTLELEVGGELFVLRHHRGETDDATWVWVPGRNIIAAGDFYMHMLPNVGNPRRIQRHPEEWADAVEEMSSLDCQVFLPGHGDCIHGSDKVRTALHDVSQVLRYIVDHAIIGLNDFTKRKDQIAESLQLPEHLLNNPKLQPHHATAKDICRMVINQYTGWWDDRPANVDPAPVDIQAKEIVRLAGGMPALVSRARELLETDIQMACHLAEWAFFADPSDLEAHDIMIDAFMRRARLTSQTIHVGIYVTCAIMPVLRAKQSVQPR